MQVQKAHERTSHAHGGEKALSLLRVMEPEVLAAPHEQHHALRLHDPVYWDPYMHAWVVTNYAEAVTVLMTYSAARTPSVSYLDQLGLTVLTPFAKVMQQQMMFMDGEMHTRLRGICAAAFTPRRVEEMRQGIAEIANGLIDRVIKTGEMDLLADFAEPLPAMLTAKLLGVPVEDRVVLHRWILDIAEVLGNFQHHPDRIAEIVGSLEQLKAYLAAQMAASRTSADDGLIASLMGAEVNGQKLTDDEVIANAIITLIGGHETTMNLIASGFLTLLRNPESLEQLRCRPEIVGSAVEELLRFESPVQHTARIAPDTMQLGGKAIPKGARVVVVLAAANRDPARFPNPDQLDLTRTDNRHLAFGWGPHFCFGAPLARMEAQIAFTLLLQRLQHPVLLEKALRWRENAGLRGLERLHIGFVPQE